MFRYSKIKNTIFCLTSMLIVASCQKSDPAISTLASSASVIAVASNLSAAGANAASDSLYLVQVCPVGTTRDSIGASELPPAVADYLSTNYSPNTFSKAYILKSASGVIGYVAVIYFNDKPVGLQFDASGNFLKVLEQREHGDLHGKGWHNGGRFDGRGHPGKDSVDLASLPVATVQYLTNSYPVDTLLKAFKNRDSSLVVLSANNGIFANVFSADGSFVSRTELSRHGRGNCNAVAESDLPTTISTYLSTTYPNYIFKKAFAQTLNGSIQNFIVFIDANNSRYSLVFDTSGNFVSVKIVH